MRRALHEQFATGTRVQRDRGMRPSCARLADTSRTMARARVHIFSHQRSALCFEQLAEVAGEMDRMERETLQGTGLEAESGNVRADGFFSVQVLSRITPGM